MHSIQLLVYTNDMNIAEQKEIITYLWQFITPAKQERIDTVLSHRTRYVTILLENIFQSHNANAVIRTADCFGLQDIHVVEDRYRFAMNMNISKGATKWTTVQRYKTIQIAMSALQMRGYSLVAASPEAQMTLDQLPIAKKIAFIFGTEQIGLSEYAREHADHLIKIPMYGFTQSFNVSVSVALCLQEMIRALRASSLDWHLSDAEKLALQLEWVRLSIPAAKYLEKQFLSKKELIV